MKQWLEDDGEAFIYVVDDPQLRINIYKVPYGDFLSVYFAHMVIPWWRRWWWNAEWHAVGVQMRTMLNKRHGVSWYETVKERQT